MNHEDRAALERILQAHPDAFIQAPELLEGLALRHGAGSGSISLIERQAQALRGRIATLEAKMADMLRYAEENEAISSRLLGWVRGLLLCPSVADRVELLPATIAEIFQVPSVGLGLWSGELVDRVAGRAAQGEGTPTESSGPVALPAWCLSADHPAAVQFGDLAAPLCFSGAPRQAQAALALLHPDAVHDRGSLALLPLRQGLAPRASGLLVLASGDPGRFTPNHGTEFLEKIAELSSAALLACNSRHRFAAGPSLHS